MYEALRYLRYSCICDLKVASMSCSVYAASLPSEPAASAAAAAAAAAVVLRTSFISPFASAISAAVGSSLLSSARAISFFLVGPVRREKIDPIFFK